MGKNKPLRGRILQQPSGQVPYRQIHSSSAHQRGTDCSSDQPGYNVREKLLTHKHLANVFPGEETVHVG